MIESIEIKNVASYDETGIQINDLKKINFIYGVNASGKTTISNFLDDTEETKFNSCSVQWQIAQPLKTLVYNKQFRDSNFGSSDIEGVFTLGKATKEEIEVIDEKRVELNKLKNDLKEKKETLEKQVDNLKEEDEEFKETIWKSAYKKHEVTFKEAFKGSLQKELFKSRIIEEFKNNTSNILTIEELREKAKIIFGDLPELLPQITKLNFERLIEVEKDEIWKQKIIGKADVNIAKLIQKLNLNDWVNEGRNFLQNDETCPFCQQKTITPNFRKQLGDYFDESFTISLNKFKELKSEYELLVANLLNENSELEEREKSNKLSKLNTNTFSAYLKTLSSQIVSNKEFLKSKEKEPSRSIDLISLKEQLDNINSLIIDANKEIEIHNKIVEDYAIERTKLINWIWKFLVEESRVMIDSFVKKSEGLQLVVNKLKEQFKELKDKYIELDKEIKLLGRNVTSIQPTVDEINNSLKSYGFLNFEIVPSQSAPNHYQIQREDGTVANSTLSEGEITFITFLYFLQLAKGSTDKDKITEERVLIIDDPISSLDSNILFVVGSLIKEIIKDVKEDKSIVKQIILLTHNVYFHKEVSFIDGRQKSNGNTHYWILRKKNKISTIQEFERKNPIHSSYDLLWQELKEKDRNSGITIQNIMRRIIEHYFKILGQYVDDDLIKKFTLKEEQDICRSLVCWINDGSHSINDDLFIEVQEDTIDRYFEVFKNVFKYTNHEGHYNMMMKIQDVEEEAELETS